MGNLDRIRWWEWLPFWRWRLVGAVGEADDIPQHLPRNGVVLIGAQANLKWLAFDCPCRAGHRIMLSLDRTRTPYWSFSQTEHLSIVPSIDFRSGDKRCHYFITNGRIVWVPNRSTNR